METKTITVDEFVRGDNSKQDYFKQGREIRVIYRSQIYGYCDCGYVTLKPTNKFEEHNGGLTVKRSQITIVDDETGKAVKKLRLRTGKDGYDDIMHWWSCNACVNDWK